MKNYTPSLRITETADESSAFMKIYKLQERRKFWFFTWWSTIYQSPIRTQVFNKGIALQDQNINN